MANINNPFRSIYNKQIEINDEKYKLHDTSIISKLKKKYNRILILYSNININILEYKTFTKEDYDSFCKNLKLIEGHFNMLYNNFHRFNLLIVDKIYLEIIETSTELNNEELIISFFGIKEDYLKLYLEQYIPKNTLDKYLNLKEINDFVDHDYKSISYNLNNMLYNLEESNYWSMLKNCNLNITIPFYERKFDKEINKITNEKVLKLMKQLENSDDDYLLFMKRNSLYTDISSSIMNKGYYTYMISDKYNNDYEKIYNIIINIKNNKELYLIVMNLLVSKEYCHLIINNYQVMKYLSHVNEKNESFIKKYYVIFKYVLSYCWISLYMEESIKKSMIVENDRFVFSINTANLLPNFPFSVNNPYTNPYFTVLIDKDIVNIKNNLLGVGCCELKNTTRMNKNIVTLEQFKKRLQIFSNTDFSNSNIFENINWNNIAITGSIITACLPTINPLMYYFNTIDNINITDNIFLKYIDHFYNTSDLDIMCNKDNIFEFIDKANEVYTCISNNIQNIDKNVKTIIIPYYSTYININENFINKKLVKEDLTLEFIIKNLNNTRIRDKIFKYYKKWKLKEIEKYIDTEYFTKDIYNIYFNFNKNIIIRFNKIQEEDIKIYENLKFKIKANKILKRDIEFFKISYPSFFSTVSKFHLPCVRAYYKGDDVKILPSCITAMMTFINIDYKYFAGTSSPYEIINKYRFRGFGTILNDNEKIKLVNYSKNVKKWQDKYNITNNIQSINNVFGIININKIIDSVFYGMNRCINPNIILVINDVTIFEEYKKRHIKSKNYSYIKSYIDINIIRKNGYITPFKKYLLESFYDNLY
tara:strand:+ start:630 stop:3086 length:2457 start_codon:yes stop_codon:yes gene_type:complete